MITHVENVIDSTVVSNNLKINLADSLLNNYFDTNP